MIKPLISRLQYGMSSTKKAKKLLSYLDIDESLFSEGNNSNAQFIDQIYTQNEFILLPLVKSGGFNEIISMISIIS